MMVPSALLSSLRRAFLAEILHKKIIEHFPPEIILITTNALWCWEAIFEQATPTLQPTKNAPKTTVSKSESSLK